MRVAGHVELEDQPELYGTRDTRERDAYAELLAREPWHWFATLTFKRDHQRASGGMHPEKADKAFRFFIRNLNESIYGPRWMSAPRAQGGIVWARGQEFHKDGKVHFHAVLAAPDRDLDRCCSRYQWHEFWFREFGRNQIEPPRSQADVLGYVSKYVTKDGEVDFSHNFGTARPPRLFESEPVARPAFLARTETGIGRPGGQEERSQPEQAAAFLSLTPPFRPQFLLIDRTLETTTRKQLTTERNEDEDHDQKY